ncbi:MAG: hypothetical protein AAB875_06185, partial [Patescibacteria group bacterium]
MLKPDYFGDEILKGLVDVIVRFAKAKKEAPSKAVLEEEVKKKLASGRKLHEYHDAIAEVYKLIGVNTPYYLEKAADFAKIQTYFQAIRKCSENIEAGDTFKVKGIIDRAVKESDLIGKSQFYNFFQSLKERAQYYYQLREHLIGNGRVPTGFYLLDEKMQGGLGKGETGLIVAPPKSGKTASLISFAAN